MAADHSNGSATVLGPGWEGCIGIFKALNMNGLAFCHDFNTFKIMYFQFLFQVFFSLSSEFM
jgi:hypothetical protein